MPSEFHADTLDLSVVADVRHWGDGILAESGASDEVREAVALIISELVTNAVRHARTAFAVTLLHDAERTRVEVFDRDSRQPIAVAAAEDATGGRGLLLVGAYAANWGTQTAEQGGITGKVVWAEV